MELRSLGESKYDYQVTKPDLLLFISASLSKMTNAQIPHSPIDEEDADDLPVIPDRSDSGEDEEVQPDKVGRDQTEKPMGTGDGYLDLDNELWDADNKAITTDGELAILTRGKARWMGYKGSSRKEFFDQMVDELRTLEEMKPLSGGDWERRIKVRHRWDLNGRTY